MLMIEAGKNIGFIVFLIAALLVPGVILGFSEQRAPALGAILALVAFITCLAGAAFCYFAKPKRKSLKDQRLSLQERVAARNKR